MPERPLSLVHLHAHTTGRDQHPAHSITAPDVNQPFPRERLASNGCASSLRAMNPRRATLAAACALAAGLTLASTGPAHAAAALSTATYAVTHTNGTIDLQLTYECDGGGTGTLAGAAVENLVAGTGTASVACDSTVHSIALTVTPVSGSFTTPGTVTITAVLVDASNVTVATLPPTGVSAF